MLDPGVDLRIDRIDRSDGGIRLDDGRARPGPAGRGVTEGVMVTPGCDGDAGIALGWIGCSGWLTPGGVGTGSAFAVPAHTTASTIGTALTMGFTALRAAEFCTRRCRPAKTNTPTTS